MRIQSSEMVQRLPMGVFNELLRAKRRVMESGKPVIDLSVGSPDLPPPREVMDAIRKWSQDENKYGYTLEAIPTFNGKVAEFYERRYGVKLNPEDEVLQLMGSQDGLAHLAMTLINPGDVVLVPDPGYPIYEASVQIAGGMPHPMPLTAENRFLPRLEAIPETVLERAKMMILNYPGNPVTAMAERAFFEELVLFAKKHEILIVHDFTYSELVFDGQRAESFLSVPGAKEVGVEFNSFSKTFNMAGCRIGYVVGHREVLQALARLMSHTQYGIFYPIQKAAEAALETGDAFIRKQVETYRSRRDALVERLHSGGWKVAKPPATMYVWAKIPEGWTSESFVLRLMEETGVVLTPGRAFGEQGEGYVRITLVQPEDRLLEAADRITGFLAK